MRRGYVWVCVLLALSARGEWKQVRGRVTYMASGTVYTSAGRNAGVQDSTLLFVLSGNDTTATLKVFAASSKSSASWIVRASRPVNVGDEIVGRVEIGEATQSSDTVQTNAPTSRTPLPNPRALPPVPVQEEFLSVKGRVSAQYFTSLYENSLFNISQPGVVVNVRGTLRDVPLHVDVYANFRTLSLGGRSPFARGATNQSRIYGLSVRYDDGENVFSVGRIIPAFSPSVGYIDGVLASRRLGSITFGATVGYQPDFALRGVSADFKKVAFFAQFASADRTSLSLSSAYARTYYRAALDREAASVLLTASLAANLFVFANTEMDLRRKSGGDFILSPRLTSAYVNLNYRITRSVSVGLGADASRPYYSFESVRMVPDSLLRDEMRSGVSASLNILLPGGVSLSNTYTPRTSATAPFGREYANSSALTVADLLSTGINLRSTMHLNANQYTNGSGYGVALQRAFEQLFDINLRFQRSSYRVKQTDVRNASTTLGADVMVFLTKNLSMITSFERLDGYGTVSNSVFAELSVRL